MRITAAVSTKQPVCVWRLAVLPDGSIVSGSSDGATQFWDGAFGTLLQRFAKHSSDVLAIEASPDGRDVFASGVDSRVRVSPDPALVVCAMVAYGAGLNAAAAFRQARLRRARDRGVPLRAGRVCVGSRLTGAFF